MFKFKGFGSYSDVDVQAPSAAGDTDLLEKVTGRVPWSGLDHRLAGVEMAKIEGESCSREMTEPSLFMIKIDGQNKRTKC